MIEVQHVDGRLYYVWLDQRLLDAIGRGSPEKVIERALKEKLSEQYPNLFEPLDPDVPF